jgi:polyisoprenoid-binding protein YceI
MRIAAISATTLALWLAALTALAAPANYVLEKDRSDVGFETVFNRAPLRGHMPVTRADLVIDFANLDASTVRVSIDAAHATTPLPFATEAMRGASILDTRHFPTISFQSTGVRGKGADAEVDGMLTIRGVTRPVTLLATLYRQAGTEAGERDRLSILLTGTILRSEYGASGWADLVADKVTLKIIARIRRDG